MPTYPRRISFNSREELLLAGYWANQVYKYTKTGTLLATYSGFNLPTDVVADAHDNFYVLEHWGQRIVKFDASGNRLKQWGTRGSGDGQLYDPTDLFLDSHGTLYVCDNKNFRVQAFTADGAFLGWYGKGTVTSGWHEPGSGEVGVAGTGPGEFGSPWTIVGKGEDRFMVLDGGPPTRIQVLWREGAQVTDADGDGIPDAEDNCPLVANPDQADADADGLGDVCDPDDDNDGVLDADDNCPLVANPDQADLDADGQGDACDLDDDGDGLLDEIDACPLENPGSGDANGDGCLDRIEDLPAVIRALGLRADVETGLLDSAIAAGNSIARGQVRAARGQLGAFVHKVNAQRGKAIRPEDADMLIAFVDGVLDRLP